jgi:hypothetical protein
MRKNTVLRFWERHSSLTHQFELSPIREVRLDLMSGGKTAGCIVGTIIDIQEILTLGGMDLLSSILSKDKHLAEVGFTQLLHGNPDFCNQAAEHWHSDITSYAQKCGIIPNQSNIAFIRMVEADHYFRGSGIAHHLFKYLGEAIGSDFPLFMLEPYPVDYGLKMSQAELIEGHLSLRSHYEKSGFKWVRTGAMVASSRVLAEHRLKPLFDEYKLPPKLSIIQ